MLSRTADHLYWMARYMERAENLARMLDTTYRTSLLPQAGDETTTNWGRLLRIMDIERQYQAKNTSITAEAVLELMIFDPDNPSSIMNCLRAMRENAHAVRGTLTSEMWETSNATWLAVREDARDGIHERGIGEFCEWVKYRSHLWRGVTQGTMLNDDAFRFIRLGTYIERADNSLRLLDSRYEMLGEQAEEGSARDYYQWSALLRALSVF